MEYDDAFLDQFDSFLDFFNEGRKKDSKFNEFHRLFVEHKNQKNTHAFNRIPYNKRIVLVPQCLRSIGVCTATEKDFHYECGGCGACAIDAITKQSRALGYQGMYVLKGGRAVKEIIKREQPEGILGVACWYEGFLGIVECEAQNITVTFFPLLTDGCVSTTVDIEPLLEFMAQRESEE